MNVCTCNVARNTKFQLRSHSYQKEWNIIILGIEAQKASFDIDKYLLPLQKPQTPVV